MFSLQDICKNVYSAAMVELVETSILRRQYTNPTNQFLLHVIDGSVVSLLDQSFLLSPSQL